ncbi:uncharacterized protein EAF02_000110 [Botrytis sinoallii]|uniref:uncharacterized protein n=1 Tax=Botrytis sinoallii TaxID=1463999 RepID=UPI0019027479|nr:uncharacterized protein EAF02_000110 [Botrytis sinoallii]KAF7892572.1 hypothetical protein EAF02_000110 [Botrytis sinoallii]
MPPNSELKGHVQPDTRPKPKTKPPASPKMPKHTQEIFESEDGQKFLETQAKKEQKKMMAAKREAEREAQFTQQGGGSGSEMPADFFNPNNQRKAKKSVAESAKARKSRKIQIVYVDGEETEFSCSDSDSDVPGGNTTAKSVPVGSKKANVTTAKGKKSKVIKPNVAKTKVTKSRAPKQSGKGVEDVESNLEPEPAASGEGKKGAKKPRAKPKVKTESEIVNAKASRDFVAAAKTMAESLAKMSEEGRAKAVLGKQFYTVLGTASGSDGAKKL